jgi:hypothetical protein
MRYLRRDQSLSTGMKNEQGEQWPEASNYKTTKNARSIPHPMTPSHLNMGIEKQPYSPSSLMHLERPFVKVPS